MSIILGAFLIPYALSLVCMGLPVFLFEMGSGQFSSEGPIGLWKICPLFQGKNICNFKYWIKNSIFQSFARHWIWDVYAVTLHWYLLQHYSFLGIFLHFFLFFLNASLGLL